MAAQYERCAECGNDYDRDYLQRIGERSICSLCRWLRAAGSRSERAKEKAGGGAKPRASARR
jgi:hypothetical protein